MALSPTGVETRSKYDQNMILDLGSDSIKAGTSEDALPAVVFPSVVGMEKKRRNLLLKSGNSGETGGVGSSNSNVLVGLDALYEAAYSTLERPIKHGIVENWPLFEHLATHCFSELGLESERTMVTLTEPIYNPRKCTEMLATTFFETFNVPAMALLPSGVCALYASGRTTGLVLDSGEGVTQITPVYDSYMIPNAANRMNYGGKEVTDHLKRVLAERGYTFTTVQDQLTVQKMKEEVCFVSSDYEADLHNDELDSEERLAIFTLPDGQTLKAGKERFRAPEILFTPSIIQSEVPSLQSFAVAAVKASAIDIRKPLLSNIVICGGNTLLNGFGKRLKEEITRDFPGLFSSISVIESPDRLYAAFSGASVVAKLPSSLNSRTVTRAMYDEEGPSVLRDRGAGGSGIGDDTEEGEGPADDQ